MDTIMNDLAKQRYDSIIKRDFDYKIELYLFDKFIHSANEPSVSLKEFLQYNVNEKLLEKYRKSYSMGTQQKIEKRNIAEIDNYLSEWFKNKVRLREYYNEYKEEIENNKNSLTLAKFKEFFGDNDHDRQCHYCGITEEIIKQMIEKSEIKTKRLITRGRTMEVDRINPYGDYSENNIILSCYWCNNAKSDEFTYEEFKENIAPRIRDIWIKRFGDIPEPSEIKKRNET